MFAPPGKQAEIYNKMKDSLAKIDDKAHPGLREQFEIAMERFTPGKPGSPGCEFISFPGFLSGPSKCLALAAVHVNDVDRAAQICLRLASGMLLFLLP